MKEICFLLALCFLHLRVGANLPNSGYYPYDQRPLSLSQANFKRYVVPQLRAMTREYHNILKRIHPIHGDLIGIKEIIFDMHAVTGPLDLHCSSKKIEDGQAVREVYKNSRKLDRILLNMYRNKTNFTLIAGEEKISALTSLIGFLSKIESDNYRLLHQLERLLVFPPGAASESCSEEKQAQAQSTPNVIQSGDDAKFCFG